MRFVARCSPWADFVLVMYAFLTHMKRNADEVQSMLKIETDVFGPYVTVVEFSQNVYFTCPRRRLSISSGT